MRSFWIRIYFVFVAMALISSGSLGGGGYLPRVGPSPLRFAALSSRLDPATALPSLIISDDSVTTNTTTSTNLTAEIEFGPQPVPSTGNASNPASEILIGPEPFDPTGTSQTTNAIPAQPGVSPQMLLRYFNRDATREALIAAPLEFTPPAVNTTPGSSATYFSPP